MKTLYRFCIYSILVFLVCWISTSASLSFETPRSKSQEIPLLGFSTSAIAQQRSLEQKLLSRISTQKIDTHHRILSATPHYAGTDANLKLAEYYVNQLKHFGFDRVILNRYDVLLPRPQVRQVTLLSPERYELKLTEPPLPQDPDTRHPNLLPPFNAYAADGDVTAEVVYVNYGLPQDYQTLDRMGISVKGKIVLARYGRSWRGVKVRLAAERGAVGCLLYSDPTEDGNAKGKVLPEGKWRPEFGVQTGSVLDMPLYPGDPQTPMRPSKPGVKRLPLRTVPTLAKIPALPISAADALPILRHLNGPPMPKAWQGGLPISYFAGAGPAKVHLHLKSDWSIHPIANVIGILSGQEEPDKIVMVGSHRDAWGFGAADPIAGSATLLESARVLGEMAKQGQRPKRSIAIASWDAEEYGFIGSTEYGEEFAKQLQGHLVAYLNREDYVSGEFGAAGTASLQPFINEVSRAVQMPNEEKTLYGAWAEKEKDNIIVKQNTREVKLRPLGAGSDYTVFQNHLGIPSVDVGFSSGNGSYHSRYDTRWFFRTYGDPGFVYGQRLSEFVVLFLSRFANATVLPFDYTCTADAIQDYLTDLSSLAEQSGMAHGVDLSKLQTASRRLKTTASKLERNLKQIAASPRSRLNRRSLARLNQVLLDTELAFLDPQGLPNRPWYRHLIYAPGYDTGYRAKTLAGVREAIEKKDVQTAQQAARALEQALDRAERKLSEASQIEL